MEKKHENWFEQWIQDNELLDKDSDKPIKKKTIDKYSPFKEISLDPNDFPSYKKTKKFYVEDENSVEHWLNKNNIYDKDKSLKEEEIWKFPPANLHSVRVDSFVDLHRLTVDQAIKILHGFILRCFQCNDKVVKVIHGKGNHSETGPKLKTAVIKWLKSDGKSYINFYKEASSNHGGAGATLIWLK